MTDEPKKNLNWFKRHKILTALAVIILFVLVVGAFGSSKQTPKATNTAQKKTVTSTKPATPTESLATLNAQSVSMITPVLNDFEQQMAQGEADAAQPNAGDVSSAFHSWEQAEQDKQNVANNDEQVNAYNKADNAYYYAHQTAPAALSNWDTDAGNLPGDISDWANAEEMVADIVMGTPSPDNQYVQTANNDLQKYKSDLAKAQADLSQL